MNNELNIAPEILFAARAQHQAIMTSRLASSRLLFNDIVRCACYPAREHSKQTLQVINQHLSYRAQYRWVLNELSQSVSQQQAAASSADTKIRRRSAGFTLFVDEDTQNPQQAFATLELTLADEAQHDEGVYLHCHYQEKFYIVAFMQPIANKRTQLLLQTDSLEYQLLTDASTAMYLT